MRLDHTDVNSGQILVSAVHPEFAQADLSQLGAKCPLHRREQLHVHGTKSRLIGERIGKAEYPAPRHFRTPGFAESKTNSSTALLLVRSDELHPLYGSSPRHMYER